MTAIVNGIEMSDEEIEKTTSRQITGYTDESDFVAVEFELKNVTLEDLRNQFGFQEDDPYFFYVYDVEPKHAPWVEKHSGQKLDFTKYQYFLDSF